MIKYIKEFWKTLGPTEKLLTLYLVSIAVLILIATN